MERAKIAVFHYATPDAIAKSLVWIVVSLLSSVYAKLTRFWP